MDISKDKKKEKKLKSILVPAEIHYEVVKLSAETGLKIYEIIGKSIDLYKKASIFDNLR